jgi:uncharacterized protein involved in type VI secretion and phage assembly
MKASNGVYPAIVVDNVDPENIARVRIRLAYAHAGKTGLEAWARVATLMAGANRGTWFFPDVGDEVLVAFEAGDPRFPFVIGALWNGTETPPATADAGNDKKLIRSRNGLTITLDDQDGNESIVIETPGGQKITLEEGPGAVVIADGNGNSVALERNGITLSTSSKVTVNASTVEVNATAVSVNAPVSRFSGIVQCESLISNSVVSDSYTPGAGNVW